MSSYGFVYIMSNPAMPGVYKIGMTMRSPHGRAAELSAATGVPAPFNVLHYVECESPALVEKDLHDHFDHCRVSGRREFFRIDLFSAVDRLSNYCITEWTSREAQAAISASLNAAYAARSAQVVLQ